MGLSEALSRNWKLATAWVLIIALVTFLILYFTNTSTDERETVAPIPDASPITQEEEEDEEEEREIQIITIPHEPDPEEKTIDANILVVTGSQDPEELNQWPPEILNRVTLAGHRDIVDQYPCGFKIYEVKSVGDTVLRWLAARKEEHAYNIVLDWTKSEPRVSFHKILKHFNTSPTFGITAIDGEPLNLIVNKNAVKQWKKGMSRPMPKADYLPFWGNNLCIRGDQCSIQQGHFAKINKVAESHKLACLNYLFTSEFDPNAFSHFFR